MTLEKDSASVQELQTGQSEDLLNNSDGAADPDAILGEPEEGFVDPETGAEVGTVDEIPEDFVSDAGKNTS